MKQRLLHILTLSIGLLLAGLFSSSCSPQYGKTKKLYRSLDRHADCPNFKQRKSAKFKPQKGGKKAGKKRKNK